MQHAIRLAVHASDQELADAAALESGLLGPPVGGRARPRIDTRLVAAIQRGAGARCHEAAGLLQQYYFCVENCRAELARADTGYTVSDASWAMLQRTKAQLRALVSG